MLDWCFRVYILEKMKQKIFLHKSVVLTEEQSGDELLGLLLEGFVRAVIDEKIERRQSERSQIQSQQQQQQQQLQPQQSSQQQSQQQQSQQSQQQSTSTQKNKSDDLRTLVNANDCDGVRKLLQDRPYMVGLF